MDIVHVRRKNLRIHHCQEMIPNANIVLKHTMFTFYLYRLQLRFETVPSLLGQRLEYTIKLSYKYIFDRRAVNEVKKIEHIYMCVCV